MLIDALRESWVYQEICQEFFEQGLKQGLKQGIEQGREQGREEGREHRLQDYRQILTVLVQRYFPTVTALAEHQAQSIEDTELLHTLILQLIDAQDDEEAKTLLEEQPCKDIEH